MIGYNFHCRGDQSVDPPTDCPSIESDTEKCVSFIWVYSIWHHSSDAGIVKVNIAPVALQGVE